MKDFLFPLILALILSVTPAWADTSCVQSVSKAEATKLLDKVQKQYSEVHSIRAKFEQYSELAALDQSEKSSGQVIFKKPGMMRWDYQNPEEQVFLIRDKTLWLYQVQQNQVLVDSFEKVVISDLPVAFLMGLGDLKSDFDIASACQVEGHYVFKLTPRPKDGTPSGELQSFDLSVAKQSMLPVGATVVDVGGNSTRIELSELKVNSSEISDKLFAASFPTGVDVINRREEVFTQ